MLSSRRPLGLGQPACRPSANPTGHLTRQGSRCQSITRASGRDRFDSLVAATTLALLVEGSVPSQLSWWSVATAANTEGIRVVAVAEAPEAAKRTATSAPAGAPAPAVQSASPDSAAQPEKAKTFRGLFGWRGGESRPAAKQAGASASQPEATPQGGAKTPEAVAVAPAVEAAGPGAAAGGSTAGTAESRSARTSKSGDSEEDREPSAKQGDTQAAQKEGSDGGNALLVWALERAALVAVGGVAGVAVVRAVSSPASRAIDVDALAAAASTRGLASTSPPASASFGQGPAAGVSSAATAAAQPPVPQQQQPGWRGPYGGYEEGYSYPGETYGWQQWDEPQRSGSAGRRRAAARGPPGYPQPPGRWLRPAAPPSGGQWPPSAGMPPYADGTAQDYEQAPPIGPYYGPPPPPWWRPGPYAEYERYGLYDGTYGAPPPYRGYGWEDTRMDPEAASSVPGEGADPYASYLYGPPVGYWSQDPRRRGARGPYEGYEPPYGPPSPPAAPAQPGRGFSGMRASPGVRLGRNPWEAVEREQDSRGEGGSASAAAVPSAALPAPSGACIPSVAGYGDLQQMDAALARLQAQIDELQGEGGSTGSKVVPLPSLAPPPASSSKGRGDGRTAEQRTRLRDWRQQLQEEAGQRERTRQQQQWRQVDEEAEADTRGDEGRQQRLYDEERGAAAEAATAVDRAFKGPEQSGHTSSRDSEYEQLLQMWREAHPEDEEALQALKALGAERREGPAAEDRSPKNRTAAEAPSGARQGQQTAQDLEQRPSQGVLGSGSSGPAGREELRKAEGPEGGEVPQPPPVIKRAMKPEAGSASQAAAAPERKPVTPDTATSAAPAESAGPVGWFARLFKGFGSGGGGGNANNDARDAGKAASAALPEQPQQPQQQREAELSPMKEEDVAGGNPSWQALRKMEREAEAHAEQAQRETQQAEGLWVADAQAVATRQAVEAAEQAEAGAALAAAVEAALQGQLTEQQVQMQPPMGKASPGPVAGSQLLRSTGTSDDGSTTGGATSLRSPSVAALPGPAAPAVAPSKESLQQLKATSAAAADRAAETLARIRAMRAASAQGVGLVPANRSGTGSRKGENGNLNGNVNGTGNGKENGSISGHLSNGNANSQGQSNGHVAVAARGGSEGAAGRDEALAAEIAASQAVQSDTTTEGAEAQRAMGNLREAAEVS